jgi:tryptophanyl-tRNA synthetase
MSRVLTGIQSTGVPHLGNILGAIQPTIKRSNIEGNQTFGFIANMHSLNAIKDSELIKENTYAVAAAWLACGFDYNANVFYKQSDVPQVTELMWYLDCFMSYQRLTLAHSFKDKSDRVNEVNAGLFNYPVLMAADILLYDAEVVPVGKDQMQHLEFTRDLAQKINHHYQKEVFVIPEIELSKETMYVPGVDGQKMSKSYGNTINIFLPEKKLRKDIMKIVTDDTPLEAPKNPDSCTVFSLYSFLGSESEIEALRSKYLEGNFGYGHAKQALFELIMNTFQQEREIYTRLMENRAQIDEILSVGAKRANDVANAKLAKLRPVFGM